VKIFFACTSSRTACSKRTENKSEERTQKTGEKKSEQKEAHTQTEDRREKEKRKQTQKQNYEDLMGKKSVSSTIKVLPCLGAICPGARAAVPACRPS
jgi:hypothetical protein